MKLVFVYWGFENAGSMLDLKGYARAAQAAGHQVLSIAPLRVTSCKFLKGYNIRKACTSSWFLPR